MIQLNPAENFAIVRGLEDHTDGTTYYVQAVIRNALSDAIIATVNLVDQGDGFRFMKSWQVPQDPKGGGFYIEIITSVYTDSGYITKATGYGDKYDTYLIMERMNPNLSGGGGIGGADISYKKIKEIVDASIAGRKMQEINLGTLHNAISEVKSEITGIDIPKQEKVDLSTLHDAMVAIQDTVDSVIISVKGIKIPEINIPEPEKVDLDSVINAGKVETDGIKKDLQLFKTVVAKAIDKIINEIGKNTETLSLPLTIPVGRGEQKQKKEKNRQFLN